MLYFFSKNYDKQPFKEMMKDIGKVTYCSNGDMMLVFIVSAQKAGFYLKMLVLKLKIKLAL